MSPLAPFLENAGELMLSTNSRPPHRSLSEGNDEARALNILRLQEEADGDDDDDDRRARGSSSRSGTTGKVSSDKEADTQAWEVHRELQDARTLPVPLLRAAICTDQRSEAIEFLTVHDDEAAGSEEDGRDFSVTHGLSVLGLDGSPDRLSSDPPLTSNGVTTPKCKSCHKGAAGRFRKLLKNHYDSETAPPVSSDPAAASSSASPSASLSATAAGNAPEGDPAPSPASAPPPPGSTTTQMPRVGASDYDKQLKYTLRFGAIDKNTGDRSALTHEGGRAIMLILSNSLKRARGERVKPLRLILSGKPGAGKSVVSDVARPHRVRGDALCVADPVAPAK